MFRTLAPLALAALVLALPLTGCGNTGGSATAAGGARGEQIYTKRCAVCHEPGPKQKGPSLDGVYVRFGRAKLGEFLANPKAIEPETQMPTIPMPPQDLRALSKYLGTLK